jgi:hypothetical protein
LGYSPAGAIGLSGKLVAAFAGVDIRQVFGSLAAATAAAAVSVGGATIMTALHTTAPFWEVWNADAVGIVVVAPAGH